MTTYLGVRFKRQFTKQEILDAIGAADLGTDDIELDMDVFEIIIEVKPRALTSSEERKLKSFLADHGYTLQ